MFAKRWVAERELVVVRAGREKVKVTKEHPFYVVVQREGREWLKLLEAVDWERYKKRVAQAVKRAAQKIRREHPDEPVFTISILTDPRIQWTCITFDTIELHAAKYALSRTA